MYTHDNTSGFSDAELDQLNTAHTAIISALGIKNPDELQEAASGVSDLLNNEWRSGITTSELVEAVKARLGV